MKIELDKLIELSGAMKVTTNINGGFAVAHSSGDLAAYLQMYISGYTLSEIGDYYEMTYSSVYNALKSNVISDWEKIRPLHRTNRKRLENNEPLMTVGQYGCGNDFL